jgi:hypothetical protein
MRILFVSMFVVIFGVIGCGKAPDPNSMNASSSYDTHGNADPLFKPFIKRVKETLNRLGVSNLSIQKIDLVSINYGRVNGSAVGVCNTEFYEDENGKKIITLRNIFMDPSKWNHLSDDGKKEILAHELGHCAWGLGHLASENQIMSPVVTNINENAWIYFANQIKNVFH